MKVGIIGAGAHGRIMVDNLRYLYKKEDLFFLDDNPRLKDSKINEILVRGSFDEIKEELKQIQVKIVVAIAHNKIRKSIFKKIKESSISLLTFIHPLSLVAPSAELNEGCVIFGHCTINSNAVIKEGVIVNVGSLVEQNCTLDKFVGIGPGVHIGGRTFIGENTLVCTGANIFARIKVGKNCLIAANSLINKNVGDNFYMMGTPAKCISKINNEFRWENVL
jgi:sugar O-acyltransferase (sialic acid O-acetyltransferase NeuD family)